ncbi:uncharacterized protein LOC143433463 [Xylocopa sonorina]|uniref:uncharacterized protein LOC143433463 n=1 Tax=Xylocopa sonorina TaxID=1818115 RepID=UPI00403A9740
MIRSDTYDFCLPRAYKRQNTSKNKLYISWCVYKQCQKRCRRFGQIRFRVFYPYTVGATLLVHCISYKVKFTKQQYTTYSTNRQLPLKLTSISEITSTTKDRWHQGTRIACSDFSCINENVQTDRKCT